MDDAARAGDPDQVVQIARDAQLTVRVSEEGGHVSSYFITNPIMASALPCGDQQLRTEVSNNAASINLCNAHICNSTWRASHGLLHAGTVRLFSFAVSHAWHSAVVCL